jgi:hypothetical protein
MFFFSYFHWFTATKGSDMGQYQNVYTLFCFLLLCCTFCVFVSFIVLSYNTQNMYLHYPYCLEVCLVLSFSVQVKSISSLDNILTVQSNVCVCFLLLLCNQIRTIYSFFFVTKYSQYTVHIYIYTRTQKS